VYPGIFNGRFYSLFVDVDAVDAVLLADGWHEVDSKSFDLDAYEFHHEKNIVLAGGSVAGVPSTGARWTEPDGKRIVCPITSILAVRLSKK
jgi:hypothetical protein